MQLCNRNIPLSPYSTARSQNNHRSGVSARSCIALYLGSLQMNEATKPLTFLPARLHLWRASDGASTHVIQARDAATQDWFIIFLFVYIFFGTSATRLPGGWDAETLAYGVTPHAFCKEVHLQSWIPASHYTDPYRLSGRSRDYFLMPARMTRLSCCRFKKPTFLLTLHPKNQMCTRGGKMVLFGVYLLLISLGSYKGRGGEERGGGDKSPSVKERAHWRKQLWRQ